jgi:hypothetical protein
MVSAVNPFLPEPIYAKIRRGVQVASPDIVLDDPYMSVDSMADYIFATIGGTEILSASRSDLIDSPLNRNYTPLEDAGTGFSREEGINFDDNSFNTFRGFAIDLNRHVPADHILHPLVASGLTTDVTPVPDGTARINLKDVRSGYYVEIEILTNGQVIDGII